METTTIAEAKNNLPRLIHAAESGEDIHITRHGRSVAVLISEDRYRQLFGTGRGVFQAIMQWRESHSGIDLAEGEVEGWRDRSPMRENPWD